MCDAHHPHIIELLATYVQEGVYHFLFPLAECNLEEYMELYDPLKSQSNGPALSKDFVIWMLTQFSGLDGGIEAIHNKKDQAKRDGATEALMVDADANSHVR
jgi:hypothetical protein